MRPSRDERGQAGGLEALVFGVLVFVFGTLVVANAWAVIDAKLAAGSAVREAARSYVEASSSDEAGAAAQQAAEEAMRGHGRRVDRMALERTGGSFTRCARVTLQVRYRVPLVAVPLVGGRSGGFTVAARHSEVVDPYRSGPGGEATCDA